MAAPSSTPTIVPRPRWTARANTEPRSGLSTMATVSVTQYERCSGRTSLISAATPTHAISRTADSQISRPGHRGHAALFGCPGEQQPARDDQQHRPAGTGQQQQRRMPPGLEGAERPGAERGVDQQLQPGHRRGAAGRAEQHGHARHGDQHGDGDPAAAVDETAEDQAGGRTRHGGGHHPPRPGGVRAADVDHVGEQAAYGGEQAQRGLVRGEADGQRHADRQRCADHHPHRGGRRARPDRLDQPGRRDGIPDFLPAPSWRAPRCLHRRFAARAAPGLIGRGGRAAVPPRRTRRISPAVRRRSGRRRHG